MRISTTLDGMANYRNRSASAGHACALIAKGGTLNGNAIDETGSASATGYDVVALPAVAERVAKCAERSARKYATDAADVFGGCQDRVAKVASDLLATGATLEETVSYLTWQYVATCARTAAFDTRKREGGNAVLASAPEGGLILAGTSASAPEGAPETGAERTARRKRERAERYTNGALATDGHVAAVLATTRVALIPARGQYAVAVARLLVLALGAIPDGAKARGINLRPALTTSDRVDRVRVPARFNGTVSVPSAEVALLAAYRTAAYVVAVERLIPAQAFDAYREETLRTKKTSAGRKGSLMRPRKLQVAALARLLGRGTNAERMAVRESLACRACRKRVRSAVIGNRAEGMAYYGGLRTAEVGREVDGTDGTVATGPVLPTCAKCASGNVQRFAQAHGAPVVTHASALDVGAHVTHKTPVDVLDGCAPDRIGALRAELSYRRAGGAPWNVVIDDRGYVANGGDADAGPYRSTAPAPVGFDAATRVPRDDHGRAVPFSRCGALATWSTTCGADIFGTLADGSHPATCAAHRGA